MDFANVGNRPNNNMELVSKNDETEISYIPDVGVAYAGSSAERKRYVAVASIIG